MKTCAAIAMVAVMIGFAYSAQAQTPTGTPDNFLHAFDPQSADDLRKLCSRQPSESHYAEARSFCLGFIEGAGQFHDAIVEVEDVERMVCANGEATLNDVVVVFLEFAADNPEHMGKRAVDVVIEAAAGKWPCTTPN
jgi:hypothetical protein